LGGDDCEEEKGIVDEYGRTGRGRTIIALVFEIQQADCPKVDGTMTVLDPTLYLI